MNIKFNIYLIFIFLIITISGITYKWFIEHLIFQIILIYTFFCIRPGKIFRAYCLVLRKLYKISYKIVLHCDIKQISFDNWRCLKVDRGFNKFDQYHYGVPLVVFLYLLLFILYHILRYIWELFIKYLFYLCPVLFCDYICSIYLYTVYLFPIL